MGEDKEEIVRSRRMRDFNDLQAELSGTNAGRMRRFLTPEEAARRPGSKEKSERDESFWAWVHSAEYAARTQALSKNLSNALTATDKALVENAKKIREAEERLEDVRRRAQRLEDGRLVYRARDGSVFTDDDRQLPADEAARVPYDPNAATREEKLAAANEYERSTKAREELTRYQEKIVKHQDRMKSDEPFSQKELESMENDVKNAPASVRPHMRDNRTTSASRAYMEGEIKGPNVSSAFQNAAEGAAPARQTDQPEPIVPRGPAPT
ncbi:MAG: hypothetical protein IH604_09075 [Burkholderiales bacterium]|nr:hypothetical protein [Burkholderiales bacterium]